MIIELFFQEFKIICRSVIFIISCICILLFYCAQIANLGMIEKPQTFILEEDKERHTMLVVISELTLECNRNSFITYPFGIYKKIKLSEEDLNQITSILCEITGLSLKSINTLVENYNVASIENKQALDIIPNISVKLNDYKLFLKKMNLIDDLLGGNSDFSSLSIERKANEYNTSKEYEEFLYEDKVTRAYARYFADNMNIILAIVPAFYSVNQVLKDKKNKMTELIGSKKASSSSVVIARYCACIFAFLIVLLILSMFSLIQTMNYAAGVGVSGDLFTFIYYIIIWLFPTILFVCALSYFITELTQSIFAIFCQAIIWYISLFLTKDNVIGNIGINLIPRFNTIGNRQIFLLIYPELCFNRIIFTCMAILLIILSVWIHKYNRKGRIETWKSII